MASTPVKRAYQIALPGMTGRMSEKEEASFRTNITSEDHLREKQLTCALPTRGDLDTEWHRNYLQSLGVNCTFYTQKHITPHDPAWKNGEIDLLFSFVGMSDADPISSATFLFSPEGSDADLPSQDVLKILNTAKGSIDKNIIWTAVHNAFALALDEGLLIPWYYACTRHFHSKNVDLNIKDIFTERTIVSDIRIKGN